MEVVSTVGRHIIGVTKDEAEAFALCRKAAEQGDAAAQYKLASIYDKGEGVPRDEVQHVAWLRRAADQGHAIAQCELGLWTYWDDKGIPYKDAKRNKKAMFLIRSAALQGLSPAQFFFASLFAEDVAEAVTWYCKAADQGNAEAQHRLGIAYFDGQGVTQDYVEAHKWFNIAATNGHADATAMRDSIAKKMTPPQIAEAQKHSSAWMVDFEKRKSGT